MSKRLASVENELNDLRSRARECTACPLWRNATQTVFGEGAVGAKFFLVGEQPGDYEDREGRPFVGPAGRMLDRALELAGVDRKKTYVTNAVKHFKWVPRGKRRLHQKPSSREIAACRAWLINEIDMVQPEIIICLGVTAAQAVLQKNVRLGEIRGKILESEFRIPVLATAHPSSILRSDESERQRGLEMLAADLKVASARLKERK